jgi:hypothetical protein
MRTKLILATLYVGLCTSAGVAGPAEEGDRAVSPADVYNFVKGRCLVCCLRKGMTPEEVRRILGPSHMSVGNITWFTEYNPGFGMILTYDVEVHRVATGDVKFVEKLHSVNLFPWKSYRYAKSREASPMSRNGDAGAPMPQ